MLSAWILCRGVEYGRALMRCVGSGGGSAKISLPLPAREYVHL